MIYMCIRKQPTKLAIPSIDRDFDLSSILLQEVTEELIFESIENASGNGSDYGSCEEKDPVYEEVRQS